MKKKLFLTMVVLFSVLFLVACSGGKETATSSNGKSKITIWAWDETFNIQALEVAKAAYQKDNVEIEIVNKSLQDVVQSLNTVLSSGTTEGLPNIVLIEDYTIRGLLDSYKDSFLPLQDIVNKEDFASYKSVASTIGSDTYGVPFDSGVAGFFYRRDYLEKAGYKEADLQNITWDKFIEIARAVKEKTGKKMMTLDPSDLGLTRMIAQSAGKWYTDDKGNVTIAGNEALKYGLQIQATLIKEELAEQVSDWDGGVHAVQSGNVAGAVLGCWYSSTIQGGEEDQKGKWGIAPFPSAAGITGSVNATALGGAGWYVIQQKEVQNDAAKDFLKNTFASNKELMNTLAKEIGLVSTLKSAKEEPVYQEGVAWYDNQKVFENFSTWSDEILNINFGKDTYEIEGMMTEALQKVVNGENIDKVLEEAQKQVASQLVQ